MQDFYTLETRINNMVDELQGLCSQNGLSNTAHEEEVVTTVFLYKFLNDKFMYNLTKFGEDIDETVKEVLANENDELYAFYDEHSQDVRFEVGDTIEALVNSSAKANFYELFDDALERISGYEFNDKFKVETADGEKLPLFTRITEVVAKTDRNAFAQNLFRIITQDKFQFFDVYEGDGSFDFYSTIFEYLIKNYNVSSGTYAEYFTPQSVSSIIGKCLVGNEALADNKLYEIADFAAGSGSLVLHLANELGKGEIGNRARVFTQDISAKSSRFLRLNMMLNGLTESLDNIVKGDSMLSPAQYNVAHDPSSGYKQFDYITINPPFKLDFSSTRDAIENKWMNTDRFFAGVPNIPKRKKESMAIYLLFIQHVLWSMKDDGKAAIVLPTGFLTAQGKIEKKIRQKIIDNNWLRGVISMPSNIFANTGTNVSVLFLDKAKKDEDVVLMDASNLGEKRKEGKNQRTVLRENEINRIIDVFNGMEEQDDFSVVVKNNKIKKKNYSFSAGQYFDVKIEYINLSKDEFKLKINNYQNSLFTLYDKGKELNNEVMKSLSEVKYE